VFILFKYSSIDFVDIFIIRHSSCEHGSALIYSNIQIGQEGFNRKGRLGQGFEN